MRKKYFIIIFIFLILGAFLLYVLDRKSNTTKKDLYEFTTQKGPITLKDTTWEFIQFTDGDTIKNLVGTDWVLQFEDKTGHIRICDTHSFGYTFKDGDLSVESEEFKNPNCQENINTLENFFMNILKSSPKLEVVESSGNLSRVLTITKGVSKFSLIPREHMDVLTQNQKEGNLLVHTYLCGGDTKSCDIQNPQVVDVLVTNVETKKVYTLTTDLNGEKNSPLPFGTYTINIQSDIYTSPQTLLTISEDKSYQIDLLLKRK